MTHATATPPATVAPPVESLTAPRPTRVPTFPNALPVGRLLGVLCGIGTQLIFLVTVWYLFWFLKGEMGAPDRGVTMGQAVAIDILLCCQSAAPHSVLLHPRSRKWLGRWISSSFYGLFFCCLTCLSLAVIFRNWQPIDWVVWEATGVTRRVVEYAFLASWAALFYSLALNGLGYQTGWTPWLAWFRRQPLARRDFVERGAYRWLRHPIYLSFLGLVWFCPTITLDRAVLIAVWTAYIYAGSIWKDRRLLHYLGEPYREYGTRVPGYPLLRWGPLGRWS